MVRVKICGITSLEDALRVHSLDADAVGFLVGQAKPTTRKFIEPEIAASIIMKLPPFCSSVLVTTIADPIEIIELIKKTNATVAQLHGDSTVEGILEIKKQLPHIKVCKAINVFDEGAIDEARAYENVADAITLDSGNRATGQVGGTGETHDWNISKKIVESISLPVILAGGLNPDNVAEAIQTVRPYAVDVNSGVSNPDGSKDFEKVKLFIDHAKESGITTS